jgi:hypothetical protein
MAHDRGPPQRFGQLKMIYANHLPGDLTVKSFEPRMVCTKCGIIGADVRPNWKEREQRR